MNLQQALDAPLFDTEYYRASFYPRAVLSRRVNVEAQLVGDTTAELARRGHDVAVVPDWSLGWVSAASRVGQRLSAAASPRGMQTYAVGR
jgi:gamma-glutamyltranspeptidase/glutathione hydrolase